MNNQDIAKCLNRIVAFLHDSQSCYKDHIGHVKNPELKQLFNQLNFSREKMVKELSEEIIALGAEPEKSGTALGQAHRVYENIKTKLTNGDPLVIAKEIRRGESILIQYYQEAISEDLPQPLKNKLLEHLEIIGSDLKAVDKLAPQS
ncbi:MAG: hypothetical protein K0S08_1504 [Gammaproteobacteria bacterium]|jgi:uncharacterized protein (TIGR02284 family)|nr:hypothetical protein [Gammaproteobacteria bacterium]